MAQGNDMKEAHAMWMTSHERAAFEAGSQGIQK